MALTDYKGIPGYCDYVGYLQEDLAPRLVQRIKDSEEKFVRILEVGCLFGASACALRDGLNKHLDLIGWSGNPFCYHIVSLDRFGVSEDFRGSSNPEVSQIIKQHRGHKNAAYHYLREHSFEMSLSSGHQGSISLVDSDSLDYFAKTELCKYDLIFLDSDHTYEHVSKEIAASLNWLKTDGILAGHDYTPEWPGVMQAVDERFAGRTRFVRSVWEVQL